MVEEERFSDLRQLRIPMMPGFATRILPLLAVYWGLTGVFTALGQPIALVIGAWATVTTIMLWPIGARFGRTYRSYRTPWFLVGVVSMVGIPVFGYIILSSTSSLVTYVALIALVVDIGVWGIPASSRSAFSSPVPMMFRPDLIFGDGRLLAGGLVALGLGMKFIFSDGPPGNLPHGNWWALFFAILLGLVQIIPLRGIWKMRSRMSRMLTGRGTNYATAVAKESYLLVALVLLMFSFHNFFAGVIPFTKNVLAGSTLGLTIMLVAGAVLVLVRAGYKLRIGDPFVVESFRQSIAKQLILVVGVLAFVYGLLNVMLGHSPLLPNVGSNLYLSEIGVGMVVWGVLLLVPVRAWAQQNQRRAMLRQMVHVVMPALPDRARAVTLWKITWALSGLSAERREELVGAMIGFLAEMPVEAREKIMRSQIDAMARLPSDRRGAMMDAMNRAMVS
jgi:hypothetical protein